MLPALSHSWRSWKRTKALACVAILALAVGIGCATTIFTVVNGVMLEPLPYSHPERWVALFGGNKLGAEADRYGALSISDLMDYQRQSHSFDVFGWYRITGDFNLVSSSLVEHVEGAEVTPSLLNNVGVDPVFGRLFQDSDGAHVAVISSRLWQQLGPSRATLGTSLTLNDQLYTVIGVMPAWFRLPIVSVSTGANLHDDVWIPVNAPTEEETRAGMYAGYARLKSGVTVAQARADVKRVADQIAHANPAYSPNYTATLFGLHDFIVKDVRPYLLILLAAAGLLLVVTCADVAGLLVAKSVGRAHEIAVRVALGARRKHLAMQFILEGCLLSVPAAGLGLLISVGLTRLLLSLAAEDIPRPDKVSTDGYVVLFVAGLACATAILPSLAPLWQAVRTQPSTVLNEGVRASSGVRSRKLGRSLVIGEITLAFVLLAISGVLVTELENLLHTWPGFDAHHLLSFQLNATRTTSVPGKGLLAYQDQLLASLEALPGVSGAAFANQRPLNGCCFETALYPDGQQPDPNFDHSVSYVIISSNYFRTMGIPLKQGRLLNTNDTNENLVPVVIDEAAARHFWPNREALGSFARVGGNSGTQLQVVGVVGNVHNDGLGAATRPEIYLLDAIAPVSQMQFVVRSALPAASLAPAVRSSVRNVDGTRAIYDLRTMDEILQDSVSSQRVDSVVIGFFALAALLMAALGIYGVMSYSVREGAMEIGTRMALGASGGDVLKLIVGGGMRMAIWGVLIGIPASALGTFLVVRFVQLHHVSVLPYAYSAALIGSLTMMASSFPAWRATLLSPMAAIRNETESL